MDAVDVVFHVGDYAYADDRAERSYEQTWDEWQAEVAPTAAVVSHACAHHSLVLTRVGEVLSFGSNNWGQRGILPGRCSVGGAAVHRLNQPAVEREHHYL